MKKDELFRRLWQDYAAITPSAEKIRALLSEKDGAPISNDHIAFRTFDFGPIALDSFVEALSEVGYRKCEEYFFKEKKLRAFHFECDEEDPKIFVSELLTKEFSPDFQKTIRRIVSEVPRDLAGDPALLLATEAWSEVSYADYEKLLKESEYGGWVSAFRLRANHFTLAVHRMKKVKSLQEVVKILKEAGFAMNESGGVIKGTPEELLEQASTLADRVEWKFASGESKTIPTCYYEFAHRYKNKEGRFFPGFIAKSADKIFESTDTKGK